MSRRRAPKVARPAETRPGPSSSPGPARAGERRLDTWAGVLLAVLCLILHGRAVTFGFTGVDDTLQVVDDAAFLGDLTNAPRAFGRTLFVVSGARGYYRPVTTLSYMLDAQWAGPRPVAYHVTNVGLHLLATLLLFRLGRRLGFGRDAAVLAAAIFAVHPSTTEAASWIPARGDDLLAAFFAASLLLLLRFRERRGVGALTAHALLLTLAVFTKENAVVLPMLFFGLGLARGGDRAWLRDRRLWLAWALPLVVWLTAWRAAGVETPPSAHAVGAAVKNLPTLVQCLGQAIDPFHPQPLAVAADTSYVPGVLAIVLLGAALWWLPPAGRRLLAWGIATFLLLLAPALPVSGFLLLEHRLEAPWLGLVVILAAVLQEAVETAGGRRLVRAGGVVLVAGLALLSFDYGRAFRDADTFTAQGVRSSPRSSLAHVSRGTWLEEAGRLDEAEAEYTEALRLDPGQLRAHLNLGSVRHQKGDLAGAERLFRAELALNPGDDLATYDLAVVLMRQGKMDECERWIRETLRLNPANERAGTALADLERRRSPTH
jgi:tetratricopeptide (TPR) repeat protein